MWETMATVALVLFAIGGAFVAGVITGFWVAHEPVEPMRRRPF